MNGLNSIVSEADFDTLLADLGLNDDDDEIIIKAEEEVGEAELEAAVAAAETQDVINAHYDEESEAHEKREALLNEECLLDPMSHPEALLTDEGAPEAPKKEKKAKEPKEKKVPVRKHYSSKAERVSDKLGSSLGDYMVLELTDAALTGDDLAAKQSETMQILKEAGQKVANRMTFLIEFAAGKSANLNGIALTALNLLKSEGKIVTGEKGNLMTELTKKYAKTSANAMGNNTVAAMRSLKMITKGEDGYVPNPNSLYYHKISGMLSA